MATAYVYDPLYLEHNLAQHPENKRRLEQAMAHLKASGLLQRMTPLKARDADVDEIASVHRHSYISRVRDMAERGGGHLDPDTYVAPRSYAAALRAAGGLLTAVEAVLENKVNNAFALVRPPGHHALADRAMGFCLFNNIAIAAQYALQRYSLERVLIVDFDLHHGNGTQDAFYKEPRVLYFSTHQYPYYPGTGHWTETGQGPGKGYTVNVPLPAGTGDAGYQRVFADILVPLAQRYKPQLILASAGYDAHWADPLGMMLLSVSGYAELMRTLVTLADELCAGHLVLTLEGGYNLNAQALSIAATFAMLLGDSNVDDPLGPARHSESSVDSAIDDVRRAHELN